MGIHDLVRGCDAIEKAAASLYSRFMQIFPEEKDFWQELVKDEIEHSSFLMNADFLGILEKLGTSRQLPSIPLIENTLIFANTVQEKVRFNPVSLEEALTMSLKLEESMAEIFAHESMITFLAGDDDLLISKILTSEQLHIDKIRNKLISKGFLKMS
jgi:hypothetical protein